MKRFWVFGIAIIVILLTNAGCEKSKVQSAEGKIVKTVAVMEIKEESLPILLHYTGTATPKETKKYSFKCAGKISEVFVKEGQPVEKGTYLALLEQDEIRLTELDMEKAQANYDYVKDYYEKAYNLHETSALSQQELQEIALKLEQAEHNLEQTKKIIEISEKSTLLTADVNGYVLHVLCRENEIVSAGSPVIIVGSRACTGQIGLTREDTAKIKTGDQVSVFIDDTKIKGKITTIDRIPDETSMTYPADIELDNTYEILAGAVIHVTISAGEEKGFWIPIENILNDGEDYVYVVENNRAKRKCVQLGSILEDRVCVKGVEEGDLLITEGFKSVKDGYEIKINDGIRGTE